MGKAIMFMVWIWIIVSIAGGVAQGSVSVATTTLTADLASDGDTVYVTSTEGFTDVGFIYILDEKIGYASTTATTFKGNPAQPIVRGAGGTDAVDHYEGELVRTSESSMMNQSVNYKLAVIADSAGLQAFVTVPWAFITLIGTFFTLPLAFLGTELEILTYFWGVLTIGIIAAIGISWAGSRRI